MPWLDTGTMDSLYEATEFVRSVETRAGIHISMPEEIAYVNGWIDKAALAGSAKQYGKSPYGRVSPEGRGGKIRISREASSSNSCKFWYVKRIVSACYAARL